MDGVGGAIKNKVYRDVKSGKAHFKGAKSFAEYVDITIRNIKPLYLPLDDVLQEPSEVDLALKIKSALDVHCVRRELTVDGITKVKLFKVALDKEPFYEHYCRKQGDPDVCGYPLLPLYYSMSTIRVPFAKAHTWPKRIGLNAKFATNGFMNVVSWLNHNISTVPSIS